MPKKLTYKFVKEQFEKESWKLLSKEYINSNTKLEAECKEGHICWIRFSDFSSGYGCMKCWKKRMGKSRRLSIKYIITETSKLAEGYKCLAKEYKNNKTKIPFKCNKGHKFHMKWNHFQRGVRCPICYTKIGKQNPNWKGGVKNKNIPLYDTYAPQIDWVEKIRKNPDNKNYLQVKCTNSECRKWFTPITTEVCRRILSLNNKISGEQRFYCSEECKQVCSIFKRRKYPRGFKKDNSRPDQKEWAELIKERDKECVKCGNTENLEAHHIEGLNVNPIESADIDLGITLCHECHKEVHKEIGCRRIDLGCN